ncbi:MAG: 30S ribosomal protein S13 [Bacteroidetes bacterium]|nr:30S ribosomal protein S13 [Bacteroidota bacterium]
MARIAGVDIPRNKRGDVALGYLYGLGRSSGFKILEAVKVNPLKKVQDWSDDELTRIRQYIIDNHKVEGSLRTETHLNIKRLIDIGCYRGMRHRIGLPVRGQRTRTNCRTRKGKRKTVANKKMAVKK